jgi:Kef-type K+ transport system membrane component KefB
VRVLLTGILFGAILGYFSGFFVAGAAFTFLGGTLGMMVGAAIGLVASAVALLATAIYRLTIGRTRRGIIITSALATSLTTVAVLVTFLIETPVDTYVWWVTLYGVVVFAATALQAHRLATPTVTVPQRHPSQPSALAPGDAA